MTTSPPEERQAAAAPAPTSTAIVPRRVDAPAVSDDISLQKLWLAMQRRSWRSLAVLSTSGSIDTVWVSELIARLVWWYRGQPSTVFDLRDLSLRLVDYQLQMVAAEAGANTCAILALRSTFENPTAIPVAHSADAVVLCVELGATDLRAARETLAEVGAERVLGSIVIRPRGGARRRNGR